MTRFLLQILASTVGVLLAVFLVAVLVTGAWTEADKPAVPRGAWLVLDDSFSFTERGTLPDAASLLVEGVEPALPLRKLVGAVDAAATDPRIEGLVLLHTPAHNGWAGLSELHAALLRFREAGKPVRAFAADYDEAGWFLATAADEITMAPLGLLEVDGIAAELMYFAEALEKAGVEVQVTRVGRYKSAVEPFLEREMSEANREQIAAVLEVLQGRFLAEAAAARGMELATLEAAARDEGLLTPERAVELGLIDRVAPFDVFLDELETEVLWDDDAGAFAQVGIRTWLEVAEQPRAARRALHVVVAYAEGEILDGEDEEVVGGDTLARQLRHLRVDDEVDAVVLRVDSPGGSASASEVVLREMQLLRDAKPVVVSMGAVAASGGYWIACQADRIVAHPQTITGSIGVYGMFPNVEGLLGKLGVNVDTVKTTATADLFSPFRSKEEAELARIQVWIDEVYEAFLDRVAEGRGLERARVEELAQGRIWSGQQALELGLVDALGGLDDAVEIAARLAGDGKYSVEYLEPEPDEFDRLLGELAGLEDFPLTGAGLPAGMGELLPDGLRMLGAFARALLDGRAGHAQARLPYLLELR